jgi:hypothetical protein
LGVRLRPNVGALFIADDEPADAGDIFGASPVVKVAKPRKSRIHFDVQADVALLKEVQNALPLRQPHGKVRDAWERVASGVHKASGRDVDAKRCQERYKHLMSEFRRNQAANLRKSGKEEDFGEWEQLLQDLKEQEDEIKQENEEEKTAAKAKRDRDEADGERLRDNAVKRMRDRARAGADTVSNSSSDEELSTPNSSGLKGKGKRHRRSSSASYRVVRLGWSDY